MHGLLSPRRVRERGERGAVAVIVALSMTTLLVVAAMVLDFGLVRIDRQIDRAAADEATLAGLHGLNTGDATPHPAVGVCTAAKYLKASNERFSGVNENTGWKNGLGAGTLNGCTDTALRNKVCKSSDRTSWAKWSWTGTSGGAAITVTIENGYDLAANQWAEDTLPATSGDNGDSAYQGCDNLAVTISQSRVPGVGSLATTSDLETAIRSVGRIRQVPGDSVPAMLLLKRSGCPLLRTGANGGGSFIHVLGGMSADGSKAQPGTIHTDSNGAGCAGSVYEGLAPNGIVAYAAPLLSNPSSPDLGKPGIISSVAVAGGLSGTTVRDSLNNVYGSSALPGGSGMKGEVIGRSLLTRGVVDQRYFPGVKLAVSGANALFASGASGAPAGWTSLTAADQCKPTQQELTNLNLTTSSKLYVNCNTNSGFVGPGGPLTINAGTVYFSGVVNPSSTLNLAKAHHVYIGNHADKPDAINISNNTSFEVNTSGNLSAGGTCTSGQLPSKAVLTVRSGAFKQSGGTLRMCRTTAIMMSGRPDGCVPAQPATSSPLTGPTSTPCGGGLGNGQFSQNGGAVDWTAPDTLDATTDPSTGVPSAAATTAWGDQNGPEDLALWSESATNTSSNYSMTGGGFFQVRGVFMVPNADPFVISGGASLNLTNAQYIATSIGLNGNTTNITMSVDPDSGVTVPDQGLVGLVR